MNAILALEDGRLFEGRSFGATGTRTGEVCFNTSMTGYQEVITDPSYRGQMVTMTYPQIGNYGINPEDAESHSPHVRALIIGELSPIASNYRSRQTLAAYFAEHDILGIEHVDTRALTKHLRSLGAMRACLTTELGAEEAVAAAQASPSMEGCDLVQEVTCATAYPWDQDSRAFTMPNTITGQEGNWAELPPVRSRIVAYDFGIKYNILRRLRQVGFEVEVVPSTTSAEAVLQRDPDGIFLSNGPGDPAALGYIHAEVKKLVGKKPIMGICLGNQILGHVFGGKTFKLKFGHRGGNQPVKDLRSGQISITSQNHGFAVDPDSFDSSVEVTHINLNDHTVEGIRHRDFPIFSVQYHPEAAPGPHDATYFFQEFAQLVDESK